MPILRGISLEHYAMHATQLFIDRSGVPMLMSPQGWGTHDRKSTLFKLIVKFFLKGVVFMLWHDTVYYAQGYHTVLISKICPYFLVLRLRKHYCPYF